MSIEDDGVQLLRRIAESQDRIENKEAERRAAEDALRVRVLTLEESIHSTSAKEPGIAMRLDRLEQTIARAMGVLAWIGGGGLLGLAATVGLLWYIGKVLSTATGGQ